MWHTSVGVLHTRKFNLLFCPSQLVASLCMSFALDRQTPYLSCYSKLKTSKAASVALVLSDFALHRWTKGKTRNVWVSWFQYYQFKIFSTLIYLVTEPRWTNEYWSLVVWQSNILVVMIALVVALIYSQLDLYHVRHCDFVIRLRVIFSSYLNTYLQCIC